MYGKALAFVGAASTFSASWDERHAVVEQADKGGDKGIDKGFDKGANKGADKGGRGGL